MSRFIKTSLTLALAFILAAASSAQASVTPEKMTPERSVIEGLLDGHKVVNVVDDFLTFWEQAKGKSLRRQRRLWMRMVESRHRDYFDRAVYRNADEQQRRMMLDQFLIRVPDQVEAIRKFNKTIMGLRANPLVDAILYFKYRFQEYQHQRDIYVGLSLFRFDGSVRPVQNDAGIPDTLCLAADVLAGYSPGQVRIAIAHEFFHLYHFGFLFQQPSLAQFRTPHMPLMIEGMAVAGAEEVFPYQPHPLYLSFSERELTVQREDLDFNSEQFLKLIKDDAPPEKYEQWFTTGAPGDTPSRGGYLLGYEVTKRVLAAFTLEQMVRMTPAQLREHAEEQLSAMATDRILLIATPD